MASTPTAALKVTRALEASNGTIEDLARSLAAAKAHQNRLLLAQRLIEVDLPAGFTIALTTWEDEPNADGTYDMDLAEAYDADDDEIYDLGGHGAIGAGRYQGGLDYDESGALVAVGGVGESDWAIFYVRPEADPLEARISVDKVYAWVANLD